MRKGGGSSAPGTQQVNWWIAKKKRNPKRIHVLFYCLLPSKGPLINYDFKGAGKLDLWECVKIFGSPYQYQALFSDSICRAEKWQFSVGRKGGRPSMVKRRSPNFFRRVQRGDQVFFTRGNIFFPKEVLFPRISGCIPPSQVIDVLFCQGYKLLCQTQWDSASSFIRS